MLKFCPSSLQRYIKQGFLNMKQKTGSFQVSQPHNNIVHVDFRSRLSFCILSHFSLLNFYLNHCCAQTLIKFAYF